MGRGGSHMAVMSSEEGDKKKQQLIYEKSIKLGKILRKMIESIENIADNHENSSPECKMLFNWDVSLVGGEKCKCDRR